MARVPTKALYVNERQNWRDFRVTLTAVNRIQRRGSQQVSETEEAETA